MRHLLLLLGLGLPIGVASGQTLGEITGEVKDQSGAIAPNASITAINTATSACVQPPPTRREFTVSRRWFPEPIK